MLLCFSDYFKEELWKRRGKPSCFLILNRLSFSEASCQGGFLLHLFVSHSWFSTDCCFQKQAAKDVPSKPVNILSEAAMRNAYYTCHNVQVTKCTMIYRLQCNTSNIKRVGICWSCGWTTLFNEMLSKQDQARIWCPIVLPGIGYGPGTVNSEPFLFILLIIKDLLFCRGFPWDPETREMDRELRQLVIEVQK